MIEHRLIERMLAQIRKTLAQIEITRQANPLFIDTVVDFIRTYADRTHHGKEEDILFREFAKKDLSEADRRVMDELLSEHAFGRTTTKELVGANTRYRSGDHFALADIVAKLRILAAFYPRYIEKEDKARLADDEPRDVQSHGRAPPDARRYLASGKQADYGGQIPPFQKVGGRVRQGSEASPNRRSPPPSYRNGHAAESPSPAPGAGAPALFRSSIDVGGRAVGE